MAHILITSGPTRQYLDPVRYLTNASSGRMGAALAEAAIQSGHDVIVVSGPVDVEYPKKAKVVSAISTEDMLKACLKIFPKCEGLIAAAAPCDYRPVSVAKHKIRKTGATLKMQLVETADVVASLASVKDKQWMVAFALETKDAHMRALQKLEQKSCDLVVVNGPEAVHALNTSVEILDKTGDVIAAFAGSKLSVGKKIFRVIQQRLIQK
ncbi:MAG TPA: phosphopantothenoylcysteine decarboxylase [Thermoguttaceae bacterium]